MTQLTETERRIVAIYTDDGPAHPGGQDMARTMPRRCAHLFESYEQFREADQTVGGRYADRRNARYTEWLEIEQGGNLTV